MHRLISPSLEQLSSLRTPLTLGEQKVLDFFCRNLPQEWEIYIQPHLNGLRPDFVLLNPKVGIAVFEVKDWNLNALPYRVKTSAKGSPELWATSHTGVDFRVRDNPVEKADQYKDSIINLYCPRLAIKSAEGNYQCLAVVTAGVIMTEATTQQAKNLFQPFQEHLHQLGNQEKYHPISGKDALDSKNLAAIFPSAMWRTSKYMQPQFAADLRAWLIEPDFAATQRQPLELNKKQKSYITTRTPIGYRRIKGSAGSGKSLVLAGRAAQLSSEGKDVLVVSFNITLWHYLRDLAVRHQVPNKKVNSITWCHFHEWCKRVCYDAGYQNEYRELWKGVQNPENLERILEFDMINLVNLAIDNKKSEVPTFDAILVDEGQDYNLDWWNTLRKVRRKGGEMLLVADETQDLYQRTQYWTDEKMEGAGFKGSWVDLDTCYRTPRELIGYLKEYAVKYLPNTTINLPEPDQEELNLSPVQMRWIQVDSGDNASISTQAVLNMPIWTQPDILAYSDIVLLVQNHQSGLECVSILEKKGVRVAHVFGRDHREQKQRKLGFFMGDARVKAATIHSFKGWESCCMVINIERAETEEELAAIYVALSRLKRRIAGSYITVVCSVPHLAEFGETWELFEWVSA
ncbi:nuclease-related domain-containing DEAD/DEAH box helicase [Nostoc sp. FACHB-190]|uniref:nuclease-related domain-containing DEAD/DEAH box helicase n=1 Tax=Nostoc sp. FACHB-190 TaxID=2692838 RepID=UPI00168972D6|nr:NERD domain-containing protein/DEAD/DEAH box helicase [Nostoc sp. FACHB-190]MBD2302987.1 NERD domain-containing protein [Nostoc sp. FACHB-190]